MEIVTDSKLEAWRNKTIKQWAHVQKRTGLEPVIEMAQDIIERYMSAPVLITCAGCSKDCKQTFAPGICFMCMDYDGEKK